MDTDSLYIALAHDTIDECVKPELKSKWFEEKWNYFASEDKNTMIDFEGHSISYSQWDKRTPGLFKPEFVGLGMICINSKVYIIWNDDKSKTSCKGTQQSRNELLKEDFLSVVQTQQSKTIENAGFIKTKSGEINIYTQEKVGMGYFYAKRKVLSDGVSTTHLDI